MTAGRRRLVRSLLAALALSGAALGYLLWHFHFVLARGVPTARSGPLSARLPAADRLRFFVIGDTGSGDRPQLDVAEAMDRRCREVGLDGIIHVGDIFYEAGVNSTDDPQWRAKVEVPYGLPCLGDKPIFAVHGNHDLRGDPNATIEYGRTHARWVQPNRFYERRFGNLLQLVALDGWYPDWCGDPGRCSVDFARQALEKRDTAWRIVFSHYPLGSGSAKRPISWRSLMLRRLLCDADVDLHFAGHDHHLEHRVDPACGPELFISGGGGYALHPVEEGDPLSRFLLSAHGFAELELDARSATVRFFAVDSHLLYEARLLPGGGDSRRH